MALIKNVPTNVITGFLGVGKTTAILQLLKTKPANERWAVLVNEFGEVGIDGSLLGGNNAAAKGLFITEVAGGCMCCASGVPMKIALNALLTKAKPDRLLIEPTGLGHPKEVLKVLQSSHYQSVLQLNATLTLVDARNISDSRYTTHDTFNQQLLIADIVIGNKADLYAPGDRQQLMDYLHSNEQTANKPLHFVGNGEIEPHWLVSDSGAEKVKSQAHHHHEHTSVETVVSEPIPSGGYLTKHNSGEGFNSLGWRFCPTLSFDRQKLQHLLSTLEAQRVKAVFNTPQGAFGYNKAADGLTETLLETLVESRIEIISTQLSPPLQAAILACVV
jgi:G3E family GTPase